MKLTKGTHKLLLFITFLLESPLAVCSTTLSENPTTYYQQVFENPDSETELLFFLTSTFPLLPHKKIITLMRNITATEKIDSKIYEQLLAQLPLVGNEPFSQTLSEEKIVQDFLTWTNNYLSYHIKKSIIGALISPTQPLELQPIVDTSLDLHTNEEQATQKATSDLTSYLPPNMRMMYTRYQHSQLQKKTLTSQTKEFIQKQKMSGYLEINTPGIYIPELKKEISLHGPFFAFCEKPTFLKGLESGFFFWPAKLLSNSSIRSLESIPDTSIDLVTCYSGLHTMSPLYLESLLATISRIVRTDGLFIIREYNAKPSSLPLLHVIHTVIQAINKIPPTQQNSEVQNFQPIDWWIDIITKHGFIVLPLHQTQQDDPTDNRLICFRKIPRLILA